jgi:hypothetical protein
MRTAHFIRRKIMSFQVNQGSNIKEEHADIVVDGVRIVHIEKQFGEPAVVSVYTDGPEPTHVIDLSAKPQAEPLTEEKVLKAMKKAKVEVPIE